MYQALGWDHGRFTLVWATYFSQGPNTQGEKQGKLTQKLSTKLQCMINESPMHFLQK